MVRRDQNLWGQRLGGAQLRLRLLPARRAVFEGESGSLRSQLAAVTDGGRGTRQTRHVYAVSQAFQPYGLKSECFYVGYGLAENTLAVSLGGRNIISVNKHAFAMGKARMTTEVSEIGSATQIVSCGTPYRASP